MAQRVDGAVRLNRLLLYAPVGLAIGLMLPRLLSAQFGFFDDAVTLRVSGGLAAGDGSVLAFEAANGRLRILYWLQYALIYRLAGTDAVWFYLWNTAVLAGTVLAVISLVRRLAGDDLQAALSGLFLVLAGPVVENAYTLSKPELLQSALLVGALLVLLPGSGGERPRGPTVLRTLAGALLFLGASMTKETGLIMLPISVAWMWQVILIRSGESRAEWLRRTAPTAVAAVLAVLAYLALRALLQDVSLTAGTYSNNFEWTVARFQNSAIRWAGWLVRDFSYLAPLALAALLMRSLRSGRSRRLVLASLIWAAAWIAIYLPWEFTVEYYMLPVALAASVIAAAILVPALRALPRATWWMKAAAWILLGLTAALWLTTLPNNYSNARQQLAVDAANQALIDFLTSNLQPDGNLLLNIQQPNEYVVQIEAHLREVYGFGGVTLEAFDPEDGLDSAGKGDMLIAVPSVENQPLLGVRMGVVEATQAGWNRSLQEVIGMSAKPLRRIEHSFRLSIIDLPRLLCPLIQERGYCAVERPYLDTRQFKYGWEVYQWPATAEG